MNSYCISLLFLVATLLSGCGKKPAIEPSPNHYTPGECYLFWDREMAPVIQHQLFSGTTPYPVINEAFTRTHQLVTNRFGPLNVSLSTNYHDMSPRIEAASGVATNGIPNITLFIPSLFTAYEEMTRGNWPNQTFKTHLIVVSMHELQHLAFETNMAQTHVSGEGEAAIWAKTAEEVLTPLVEKYGVLLVDHEKSKYDAWVRAGRNASSPEWIAFIKDAYSPFDGRR